MTLAQAKAKLRAIGYVLSKRDGEYRVVRKGGPEAQASYTDDLDDAVSTAEWEHARGVGFRMASGRYTPGPQRG